VENTFSPLTLVWRLAPGVSLGPKEEAGLELSAAGRRSVILSPPDTGLNRALLAISEGAGEDRLLQLAGEEAAARLYYYLAQLVRLGLLEASVDRDGVPTIRLLPRHWTFDLPRPRPLPQRVTLDRFACLRRTPRGAVLQAPETPCDLILHDPACGGLIARVAAGPVATARVSDPADRALLMLLMVLGFAADADATEAPARQTWEFHDRLFHRATRSYKDGILRGGTYRLREMFPAPPALHPCYPGDVIALPSPSPQRLARSRSLLDVMEGRRSRRAMAAEPLGLDEAAEVLYRVARVTAVLPHDDPPQDCMLRPFPSGGAIHELEFYLAVGACAGLEPGFYHYRGQEHALTRLADAEASSGAMLAECAWAWGQPEWPPQVLVVIASRLPRLAWKYEGIAYKISLMNAGAALQSLYLVVNDLGLAGCAAGSGDPDLFTRATGCDPWDETSIAEFGFGRLGESVGHG
jgi:SagB-type dehydrogenase family enzyme